MAVEKNKHNLEIAGKPEDLSQEDLARFVMDMFHRTVILHGLWFNEAARQFGMPRALDILKEAWPRSCGNQVERLGKTLGFETTGGLPKVLLEMPRENLFALADALGLNWYVQDGVWFTSIEAARGIFDAKRCNDSCWTHFTAFEASSIKQFLGLPEEAGLEGLKRALAFRMYARVNVQSIVDDGPGAVVFRMNDCRVQSARQRKSLPDYDCKSAGLVEYRGFAETIDSRIETACIACPPDPHPAEWFCSWRFSLKKSKM